MAATKKWANRESPRGKMLLKHSVSNVSKWNKISIAQLVNRTCYSVLSYRITLKFSLQCLNKREKWQVNSYWVILSSGAVYYAVQYVVLGPRLKVINLNIWNILPESSRNELKYSLKIAFMFFSIILKFQVPDINILLGVRKKATVFDGPWSASQVSSTKKT